MAEWWISFYLTKMGPEWEHHRWVRDSATPSTRSGQRIVSPTPRGFLLPPRRSSTTLTITGESQEPVAEDLERWYESGAEMPVIVLPPNRSPEELDQTLVALRLADGMAFTTPITPDVGIG